ncbi:MAG: hypothetical protein H8E44_25990 [Planctomycetes bacterium]|nr:hypothetical protein [Planctomycetota bacterium]MBL7042056.1 hypothetical protein [Pirellulaceae bacterium]
MAITVVDYSDVYFAEIKEGEVPRRRDGKFVLMANNGNRFAVFSPRGLSFYHANIVERFLSLQGIGGQYNAKRDSFQPQPSTWEILGGGHWQLDEEQGTLRLFGRSQAYGGVDLEALADQLRSVDGFPEVGQIAVG